MRISDWSSDVCSSVLARRTHRLLPQIPWVGIGKALLAVLQAVTIADRAPIRHGIAIKRLPDHLMRDASRLARGLLLPRFVALAGGEAAERRFSTPAAQAVIIVPEKGNKSEGPYVGKEWYNP